MFIIKIRISVLLLHLQLKQITEISSRADYIRNDRDQALIEICVTRVTSCIKETGTLEKYCCSLVALLESCLHHNLMPVGHLRDDDPPHAKIASDIIACIVLVCIIRFISKVKQIIR